MLPKWLSSPYLTLYLKFDEEEFQFKDALKALNYEENKLRVVLSKLRKLGLLSTIKEGKKFYRLLDMQTWLILNAFGWRKIEIKQGIYYNLALKIARCIIEKFGDKIITIAIFGSVARGCGKKESDIDLLLIFKNFEVPYLERIEEIVSLEESDLIEREREFLLKRGISGEISYVPLTIKEAKKFNPLYLDMTEDAIILYDKNNFFTTILTKLKLKLQKIGAKRIFINDNWYWILKPKIKFGEIISL